jgi:acetylornithine deacetylase
VDLWEPDPADVEGSKLAPPEGVRFDGRPQLAARFRGAGDGPSLLLNGHVDVVSSEPRERWTSDPNRAEVRGDRLYGRGACDMKGGIAAMVVAAETLARLGIGLAGDLVLCTVTDEESTGVGALAAVAHGVGADAGIVTEPSGFDVWVACRGSLIPTITIEGRPGHAGLPQPDWREGGAVNAISPTTSPTCPPARTLTDGAPT